MDWMWVLIYIFLRLSNFGNFNLLSKFNYQKGRNTDSDTDLYNMMPPNLTLAINQNVGSWSNNLINDLSG